MEKLEIMTTEEIVKRHMENTAKAKMQGIEIYRDTTKWVNKESLVKRIKEILELPTLSIPRKPLEKLLEELERGRN
jgi:hypothetical protein